MKLWFEASSGEHIIDIFICCDGVIVMSAFEWFDMDRIGVEIVCNKDVFVASTTLNRKIPS